jgi:hypothetical protein
VSARRPPHGVRRGATALAALWLAAGGALAGSLTVRDADGGTWTVADDPADGAAGFLLIHQASTGGGDPRFGRNGQVAFSLGPDAPASVRVDAGRRVWMVGANPVAGQSQPVVARFLADGSPDVRWGVQGKVLVSPNGVAVRPNDLLPLADGSVVVAGETGNGPTPHAVLFHLRADGALDRTFGNGGLWQPAETDSASTATSLAASTDGVAAVAVAVRGAKPQAQLWALTEGLPTLLQGRPLDTDTDGEDLRAHWGPEGWSTGTTGNATAVVPPASLGSRPAAPVAASAPTSDPGSGGFNPFEAEPASAPQASDDTDLPWPWIAGIAALVLAAGVWWWQRVPRRP